MSAGDSGCVYKGSYAHKMELEGVENTLKAKEILSFSQYLVDNNVLGCTASARAANNYIEAEYGVSDIKIDVSKQIKDGIKE